MWSYSPVCWHVGKPTSAVSHSLSVAATRWDKQVYAFCAEHGIAPNVCASEFDAFSRQTQAWPHPFIPSRNLRLEVPGKRGFESVCQEGDVELETIRRASEGDTGWMRTDRRLVIVHRA